MGQALGEGGQVQGERDLDILPVLTISSCRATITRLARTKRLLLTKKEMQPRTQVCPRIRYLTDHFIIQEQQVNIGRRILFPPES